MFNSIKKTILYMTTFILFIYIYSFNFSFAEKEFNDYVSQKYFDNIDEKENNDILINYLNDFNKNPNKMYIDKIGNPIDSNKIDYIEQLIIKEKYNELKDYLTENEISLGYSYTSFSKTNITNSLNSYENSMLSVPYEKGSYTERFYEIATGKLNGKDTRFRKDWTTVLTGYFTLNNKGEIISSNGCVIDTESTNFGFAFSPYITQISTNDSYQKPNTLICNGRYTMKATLTVTLYKDFSIGSTLDFGTIFREFRKNV